MAAKSFRDSLLPAVDIMRAIPATLGLRLHTVSVLVRVWSGGRPGLGLSTDNFYGLHVGQSQSVGAKVRNVSQKEAIASGGLYTEQDLIVGPITPPYTGSQLDNDQIPIFDPIPPIQAVLSTEVFFLVKGPGYSAGGDWFKKIAQRTDQPFRYMIWLRKTGETPQTTATLR